MLESISGQKNNFASSKNKRQGCLSCVVDLGYDICVGNVGGLTLYKNSKVKKDNGQVKRAVDVRFEVESWIEVRRPRNDFEEERTM